MAEHVWKSQRDRPVDADGKNNRPSRIPPGKPMVHTRQKALSIANHAPSDPITTDPIAAVALVVEERALPVALVDPARKSDQPEDFFEPRVGYAGAWSTRQTAAGSNLTRLRTPALPLRARLPPKASD